MLSLISQLTQSGALCIGNGVAHGGLGVHTLAKLGKSPTEMPTGQPNVDSAQGESLQAWLQMVPSWQFCLTST